MGKLDQSQLPLLPEIWEQVLAYLPARELKAVAQVCQQLNAATTALLWSTPNLSARNPRDVQQLAKLHNLPNIVYLRISGVQLRATEDASSLVSLIQASMPNFQGLIIDDTPYITLDHLRVFAPHIHTLENTHAVRCKTDAEDRELVSILQNNRDTIHQVNFRHMRNCSFSHYTRPHSHETLSAMAGLPVTFVSLRHLRWWESNLDAMLEALLGLGTVREVDLDGCEFRDVNLLRKLAVVHVRKIYTYNKPKDLSFEDFIAVLAEFQELREVRIHPSDYEDTVCKLVTMVKLIESRLNRVRITQLLSANDLTNGEAARSLLEVYKSGNQVILKMKQ